MLAHKHSLSDSYPNSGFTLGRWRFAPGLASTLVVLSLVPTFLFLGFWQWQRFENKSTYMQNQEIRKSSLTLLQANIVQKEGALQDLQGRYLHTEGRFINQHTILLDNQTFKGQVGYKVLTPLLSQEVDAQSEKTLPMLLLIDRGWIPLGLSRTILPIIPPIEGTICVKGRLYQPVQGLKLRSGVNLSNKSPTWPLRVLGIDLKALEQALGYTLYPLILRLEPGDKLSFEILPFETQGGMPPIKHLGYALQWFMMALAVFIYYCVINTSCIKNHP